MTEWVTDERGTALCTDLHPLPFYLLPITNQYDVFPYSGNLNNECGR